jgi:hypothetical protein
MIKKFYWKGICNKNRNLGISELEDIINTYGYILQFKFFSDVLMSLVIEIEEDKIERLFENLTQKINLTSDTQEHHFSSNKDAQIFLSITFSKSTGNMKIEVPAV